ncbi:MAG TPA: DUF4386 family protein [Symbiobacteriaceae bacterium]|nr:DUF4386 family protein [Symbiobacteriaceae bacterium]
MMGQVGNADAADSDYKSLYKLGGVAALVVALLTLSEVVVLAIYPPPATIIGWFTLFQSNKFVGLLDLWGLEPPMYVMFIMVFLALDVVLRKANKGLMAIALIFALLGIGIFLATNNPFSMLSLSNQYTAATTDLERSTLLAAGQALLANTNQRAVGGFNTGLFLVSVAGLIVSFIMVRSVSFSKLTAYLGILAHSLSLADYLREALTSSAVVALLVILPNALLLMIWFTLVGRSLYQLGHVEWTTLSRAS